MDSPQLKIWFFHKHIYILPTLIRCHCGEVPERHIKGSAGVTNFFQKGRSFQVILYFVRTYIVADTSITLIDVILPIYLRVVLDITRKWTTVGNGWTPTLREGINYCGIHQIQVKTTSMCWNNDQCYVGSVYYQKQTPREELLIFALPTLWIHNHVPLRGTMPAVHKHRKPPRVVRNSIFWYYICNVWFTIARCWCCEDTVNYDKWRK